MPARQFEWSPSLTPSYLRSTNSIYNLPCGQCCLVQNFPRQPSSGTFSVAPFPLLARVRDYRRDRHSLDPFHAWQGLATTVAIVPAVSNWFRHGASEAVKPTSTKTDCGHARTKTLNIKCSQLCCTNKPFPCFSCCFCRGQSPLQCCTTPVYIWLRWENQNPTYVYFTEMALPHHRGRRIHHHSPSHHLRHKSSSNRQNKHSPTSTEIANHHTQSSISHPHL